MTPLEIYQGSDGAATKELYGKLEALGPLGLVAMNLFRACKCSDRAKVYRGGIRGKGSYRAMAYDRKAYSMEQLSKILTEHAEILSIGWGWKEDPKTLFDNRSSWVLYVDTTRGQCSFHSPTRGLGPAYPRDWDNQVGMTTQRVIDLATELLKR